MFYRLITSVVIILLWAPFIQTLGHVWLYTALVTTGIIGLKALLPYTTVLIISLFVWWGVSSTYVVNDALTLGSDVLVLLFGRNVT